MEAGRKKLFCLIVFALLACFPVFAHSDKIMGYGFSFGENTLSETILNASLKISVIRIEGGLMIDKDFKVKPSGLSLVADVEFVNTMANFLSFIQTNPGPWCPTVGLGAQTDFRRIYAVAEISLFRIKDKDFIYEWFPVSVVFDFKNLYSFKVDLFRYTRVF